MDKIIQYYRLCAIRVDKPTHLIHYLDTKVQSVIFTQRHINLFLADNGYKVRENVIGAGTNTLSETNQKILIFI